MKVQVFQHVPFEGIGSMDRWFLEQEAEIRYTLFHEATALPEPEDIDLLIAMGGPMSVNDERGYPWLRGEKEFISDSIRRGVPMIGVCLGAQLIASAMGARVRPRGDKEIGWFPIERVDGGAETFRFPDRVDVFHWHGETFDLPPNAVRIARSAICDNQAFQVGRNVIGLQFHLETTPETAELIVHNCRDELVDGPYIQSADTMLEKPDSDYEEINSLMEDVLSYVMR